MPGERRRDEKIYIATGDDSKEIIIQELESGHQRGENTQMTCLTLVAVSGIFMVCWEIRKAVFSNTVVLNQI